MEGAVAQMLNLDLTVFIVDIQKAIRVSDVPNKWRQVSRACFLEWASTEIMCQNVG